MTKDDIQTLVKSAVSLGRIEVMNSFLPDAKYMTKPQVLTYLKLQGLKPSVLTNWEKQGLLDCHQSGHGGTRKYNRYDLQKLILEYNIISCM